MARRKPATASPTRPTGPVSTEEEVKELLYQYSETEHQISLLRMDREQRREQMIPADMRLRLATIDAELEAEYGEKIRWAEGSLTTQLERIKTSVLQLRKSIKAHGLHMVYMHGKTKVDTDGLRGYVIAHPEAGAFLTLGDSSVALRRDESFVPKVDLSKEA